MKMKVINSYAILWLKEGTAVRTAKAFSLSCCERKKEGTAGFWSSGRGLSSSPPSSDFLCSPPDVSADGNRGDLQPTEGELRRSHKLRIGRYAQHFVDLLTIEENPVQYLLRLHPAQEGFSKQEASFLLPFY
ncbi:ABC transporter F family member 4 [Nymphaea thermarum]|nr:ABC transporter F family member 4 [Nymphaea thermarum]